ncbi:hypothetical protein OG883_04270 [Streptomyces sp. NBC_01142]|uniref:hypothetical protein n=1 Tax=Streptomyces sp. NBC_01142 TaxID=2975865 RepID=UPI0022522467|nr:hypothetical protein [Streptomyces sp. NBC_01142]MCX4819130.1 hypothetical protein [Streptomyces sp. NBC_01142]
MPSGLAAASLLVPEGAATENDITVSDVGDYLAHDEWEMALDLLEELGDEWTALGLRCASCP